jgi:hypothetical protein
VPAQIIDGAALSARMRGALKERVAALAARPPAGAGGDPDQGQPGIARSQDVKPASCSSNRASRCVHSPSAEYPQKQKK